MVLGKCASSSPMLIRTTALSTSSSSFSHPLGLITTLSVPLLCPSSLSSHGRLLRHHDEAKSHGRGAICSSRIKRLREGSSPRGRQDSRRQKAHRQDQERSKCGIGPLCSVRDQYLTAVAKIGADKPQTWWMLSLACVWIQILPPCFPLATTEILLLPCNGQLDLRNAYNWDRDQVSFSLTSVYLY